MKSINTFMVAFSLAALLSACGGSEEQAVEQPVDAEVKTFSLELVGVNVKDASTGEALNIDISNVRSAELNLNP